jgi:hypothetical protein
MFDGSHTGGSVNGTGTPILYGELVRVIGPGSLGRMQADSAPHLLGYLGVSRSGVANPGGVVDVCIEGVTPILLETGLTLAAGDKLYVSATVAGRATNVAPANALQVGIVLSTSSYLTTGTVGALVGGGGGAQGAQGPSGGPQGPQGAQGTPGGPQGFQGPQGSLGGSQGAQGAQGAAASAQKFALFYGLTAGTGNQGSTDYAATVAVHTSAGTGRVPFPRTGPTNGIARVDGSSFTLPDVGTYQIDFMVHTTEPGQLELELNGAAVPESCRANMNPTSGGHPIGGTVFVTTAAINAVLAVINPAGNAAALTITPADGSETHANSQTITIQRIA